MTDVLTHNLVSWAAQSIVLASAAALLPLVLRLRHPRTQLLYCHFALAACLLVPLVTPRIHPVIITVVPAVSEAGTPQARPMATPPPRPSATAAAPIHATGAAPAPTPSHVVFDVRILPWILAAGVLLRLCWTVAGLWQVRRYRIGATPLYPVPEPVQAAAAVTHADALFCVSPDVPGPVMLGWLAPVVLLPESFAGLGEEAQCGIACHELLHVRRGDWLAGLCEEMAAAILWFNPAAWLLLAQTRLVREQLVDAEAVRLTTARDTYIEALLSIARGSRTLDLAPAPLFLRRRHLTHRMHFLLKEVPMNKWRLLSSYCSMGAMMAIAGWFAYISFPLSGRAEVVTQAAPAPIRPTVIAAQPAPAAPAKAEPVIVAFQAPQARIRRPVAEIGPTGAAAIPPDPHEPVTGAVRTLTDPQARADALGLFDRARENSLTHRQGTPAYRLEANFTAAATDLYAGSGQLVETWLSGQLWRWTANLGGYSVARSARFGTAAGERVPGAVPMRIHMLRNAIFWSIARNLPQQIRTADVQWNGKPVTCLLFSGVAGSSQPGRLWEEEEFCIDPVSGAVQVHSIAPGTYAIYSYGRAAQFHGRPAPDRIVIYSNGSVVVDAQMSLTDAGAVDEAQLRPTPEMLARGPVAALEQAVRFPMNVPSASVTGAAKPVIVRASVDGAGSVVEEELSAASDPVLGQRALEIVKSAHFEATQSQHQMYINVRFVPQGQ